VFRGEQPAERSQEGAVDWPVPDATVKLALQHPDLVAEDHEFDVFVSVAASGRHDERQNPAQPEVHERKGHRSMMTGTWANCQFKAPIEIVAPFTYLDSGPFQRTASSCAHQPGSGREA
jgi:hypothetical protein